MYLQSAYKMLIYTYNIKGGENMPQTSLNIRIDEDLKKQAEALFSEFGMNITTAITIFAKAVVREQRIPFEIKASDEFYSALNQSILMQSVEQLNQNKVVRKTMEELEELANE